MRGFINSIIRNPAFDYGFIFAIWLCVNIVLYFFLGNRTVVDSHRYLEYATEILEKGIFFQHHNQWYFSYVLFLSLFKYFALGVGAVVLVQVLLSGVSVFCIYHAARILSGERICGLFAALLALLTIFISQWNFYILCESLLISFTGISFYLTVQVYKSRRWIVPACLVLIFTCFIKPTGLWIAIVCLGLIFYSRIQGKAIASPKNLRWIFISIFLLCILLINKMLESFELIEIYSRGEIVYGVNTVSWARDNFGMAVSVPGDLSMPSEELNPLLRVIAFVILNPLFFAKLFFGKLFAFFLHIKPYYSMYHNLWIVLTLFPCYYLCYRGLKIIQDRSILFFLCVYILLHAFTVAFTVEDWDGRFLMPVLPIIFIFAACGAGDILKRIVSFKKPGADVKLIL